MLNSNRSSHRGSRTEENCPTSYGADPHKKGSGYVNTCKSQQEQGHESQPKDELKAHTDRHQ
eukprot:8524586-Heterocapsa_arctica.AAC.1